MKRIVLISTALAIVLMMLVACQKKEAPAETLKKVTVTLDWTPNTNHTGLYVAKELGYFKELGLDVEIVQPGQNTTDQVVASGNSQFGISYQENVVLARAQGIPLVSLAAVIQHNTSGFASLKSAGITSPAQFEGKRYGSWDSPSELAILKTVMEDSGADFSKLQVVSGVYDFFTTIGKDADIEWIYDAWTGVEARNKGVELNYIPLKDLNPVFDYYTPVIICNETLLQTDPEMVRNFMAAVSKGYEYCIAEPVKAADVLLKHVPELDAELVRNSQGYLAPEYKSDAPKWGYQKNEVWRRFIDWAFDNRIIDTSVISEKAFTNDYLPQ